MRVIKGVHTGKTVTLTCSCNDWIMVEELPGELLSPLMVRAETADEMRQLLSDSGEFCHLYKAQPSGTFVNKNVRTLQ